MSTGTVGAAEVQQEDKQIYDCIIREVLCRYDTEEKKTKKALLYSYDNIKTQISDSEVNQCEVTQENGVFNIGIEYSAIRNQYYFISNHDGKNVEFECKRDANCCTKEEHAKYHLEYHNIETHKLEVSEDRPVSDTNFNIKYYNLFYRAAEYSKIARQYIGDNVDVTFQPNKIVEPFYLQSYVNRIAGKETAMGVAHLAGHTLGKGIDFLVALRFIFLPYIDKSDEEYYYCTTLFYNECIHYPKVSPIYIQVYPDIEYTLKIKFGKNIEKTYNGGKHSKDQVKCNGTSCSFTVKYATIEKEIGFEQAETKDVDEKTKKGSLFYKKIRGLQNGLKSIYQMSEDIEKSLTETFEKDASIPTDIKGVRNSINRVAYGEASWIKGSLEIQPDFSLNWRYYVPDTLTEVKRFIEATIGIKSKGSITIDLVKLAALIITKSKKVTSGLAVGTSVATGGVGAVPSALLAALTNWVLDMLKKAALECLIATVEFYAKLDIEPLSFNTIRNRYFKTSVCTEIGVELQLGFEIKKDFQLIVKAEANVGASAKAKVALKISVDVNAEDGALGFDLGAEILPFTVTFDYTLLASFTIFTSEDKIKSTDKVKNESKYTFDHSGNPKEFKFGGYKWGPNRHDLFPKDKDV